MSKVAVSRSLLIATLLAAPYIAFAHGEDKPGPHGGAIMMPGAFHTEVVQKNAGEFMVYLLDVEYKNPVTKESDVKASVLLGSENVGLDCKPSGKGFSCTAPKTTDKKSLAKATELTVVAKRAGMQGNEAVYKVPVVAKKGAANDPHHHH